MDYGDKPLVKLLISNAQFLYSTPQDLTDWSVPPSPPLPVNEVLLSMLKEIERLQRVQGTLIAAFRINMMRLSPEFSHEEFDKSIAEFKEIA
jgi:hypothetical protein